MNYNDYLEIAQRAAIEAGSGILSIYQSKDFDVELKGDNSPLTKADKTSHEVIVNILKDTGMPILSEEGRDIPYSERAAWELFWMIDPIDGTKEFIKRNGEFTVNIALINRNRPVLGVVLVPVSGDLYYAVEDKGAFKNDNSIRVNRFDPIEPGIRVVASRSHMNEETRKYVESLNDPVIVSKGSSLKLLMVAEGDADLYPRFAPTMEWDTAAAQIIVEESGGCVLCNESRPLEYNKSDLLNPFFIVYGESKDSFNFAS